MQPSKSAGERPPPLAEIEAAGLDGEPLLAYIMQRALAFARLDEKPEPRELAILRLIARSGRGPADCRRAIRKLLGRQTKADKALLQRAKTRKRGYTRAEKDARNEARNKRHREQRARAKQGRAAGALVTCEVNKQRQTESEAAKQRAYAELLAERGRGYRKPAAQ